MSVPLILMLFKDQLYIFSPTHKMIVTPSRRKMTQKLIKLLHPVFVVQSLSHVWLFATPWATARQDSLSFTISWSLLKLTFIESVMPSNISSSIVHFSSCLQSFPASGSFPMSFASDGQSIGASALALVLPMNIQSWFPLRLTGLISLQSKGISKVFSNTTIQKHHFFGTQPSLWSSSHIHAWPLEKP